MNKNLAVSLLIVGFGFNVLIWFFFCSSFRVGKGEGIFKPKNENHKDSNGEHIQKQKPNQQEVLNKTKDTDARTMYPRPWRVLDIEIQYIINNNICGQVGVKPEAENKDQISIINLVHTHAAHFEMRQIIRDSFTREDLKSVGMRRVFLLANPDRTQFHQGNLNEINSKIKNSASNETLVDFWSKVTEENSRHSDLVMGDFVEDYRNLTYKHLMGLDWVTKFCSNATFIIKQDDDIAVNFYQIKSLLDFAIKSHENSSLASRVSPEKMDLALRLKYKLSRRSTSLFFDFRKKEKDHRFFLGMNWSTLEPQRRNSKWTVTLQEFVGDLYPQFVLGMFYLSTMETARDILEVSRLPFARFFWIEDVFVTGILRELAGIEIISADGFGSWTPEDMDECFGSTNTGRIVTTDIEKIQEEQITQNEASLTIKWREDGKGSWCKHLAVVLNRQRLYFLKAFHQQEKLCYFSLHCGTTLGYF